MQAQARLNRIKEALVKIVKPQIHIVQMNRPGQPETTNEELERIKANAGPFDTIIKVIYGDWRESNEGNF